MIQLPPPKITGATSVEAALHTRRSARNLSDQPLQAGELGQLLWAAQGVTAANGLRTAPSVGALHPLELHVMVGGVTGVAAGTYRYLPGHHALEAAAAGDRRAELAGAALGQPWVLGGAAVVVVSAALAKTTGKYGEKGERYVYLEAGHAAQNLQLQAVALGLGTVTVASFDDAAVSECVPLPPGETPIYLIPVGHR